VRVVTALAVLASLVASPSRAADGIAPGVLVEKVPIAADPRESYALYLPTSYTPSRPSPILYAFDPGARGRIPVERFRAAAERYGWIVVGSNASRNGMNVTDILRRLWDDTHAHLAIDERRVYTAGFSGGARVASSIALSSRDLVAGVVAFGAGFPNGVETRKDLPFVFFAGAGRDDFNLLELRQLTAELDAASVPNRLEIFEGAHEWAPAELCTLSVEWLERAAMRAGTRAKDDALVAEWVRRDEERARQREAAGSVVEAADAYDSLAEDFRGLRETSAYVEAAARIRNSAAYKDALRAQRDDDRRQARLVSDVAASIQRLAGDADDRLSALGPLRSSIADLKRTSEKGGDGREGHVARRALGSTWVQALEASSALRARKEYRRAAELLAIAGEVRPGSATQIYNLACLYALGGADREALQALTRAVDAGFRDVETMRTDSDLDRIRRRPEFAALLERARTAPKVE
jgi:predicted esterase